MKTLNDYVSSNPDAFRQEELILEATELIAKMLTQQGLSRTDLASRMGKSKAFISQCLSGEQNLTLRTLSDIFGAVGYRLQLGATPVDHKVSKPLQRLYPVGGWSFKKSHIDRSVDLPDCCASVSKAEEETRSPEIAASEAAA